MPSTSYQKLEAVLFDLGETLLDPGGRTPSLEQDQAEQDFRAVYDYVQTQVGSLPPWPEFYADVLDAFIERRKKSWRTHESLHIGEFLADFFQEIGIPQDRIDIDHCVRLTYGYSDQEARLWPPVVPLLKQLADQGLKLGLISNTIWPGWCHDETLSRLGVRDYFQTRIYSADVPYTKDHPSIFQKALCELGVEPARAVYVGDHLDPDISGAQGVGMKGILYRVPYRTERHPGIVPDATIDSLADLPEILEQLYARP